MASNPMQKKARNSFLLGMVITLVVCILIAALLYFLVIAPKNKKEEEERGVEVLAYVLSQNVASNQTITSDMFKQITVYSTMVPSNYITGAQISSLQLQDVQGNILYTGEDQEGNSCLYINQSDNTNYETITNNEADRNKVKIEQDSGGYYKTTITGQKEYVEFLDVPVVAKVDMPANTILTTDLISKSDQITTDDVRYVEYNMLVLPTTIAVGDYIDIRLTLPNGQDLIVVSKKEVKSLLGDTVGLELTEGDILMMESAIVEAYIMTASKLYVTQYVEPGNQVAALKTYVPTAEVQALIRASNNNIQEEAKAALVERFSENIRTNIDSGRSPYNEDRIENIETELQEEIENARAAREAYLSGLTSY